MATVRKVTFPSNGIPIVGDLYLPPSGAPDRKRSAIVVSHPWTGVKEQTAGLHAQHLASAGFVALAFDAAYQGESGGEPRLLENPFQRAEDARAAVTFLSTLADEVDPERVGALGICALGGYVPFAAQTDTRMKAVATVSGACVGRLTREGLLPKGGYPKEQFVAMLKSANALRVREARKEPQELLATLPDNPEDVPESAPDLFRDAAWYYRTDRARHPRAPNKYDARSADLLGNYDSYAFNDLISPRPLLMIAGTDADTLYFSEAAIEKAKEPKELFLVKGKRHVDLYDDLSETMPKLVDFFAKNIV
ncbi:Alpha/Beta hydrolase protein [Lineolata rhizophorae]|uniref:Alpha/Beta hydrolase protein n=1 Tax=Lineolata rhizophorae TaxID=578093 RepID=A0A6A6P0M9_9PEZI|nr:Alpha/Beta hydrolase protein [Lineolata rhizophorae]